MKNGTFLKKLGCGLLSLVLLAGLLPVISAPASAAVDKLEAYDAYYQYMLEEVASLGSEVRDDSFYKIVTPGKIDTIGTTEKILAAHLLDVTGDGVEELFLKRYVTYREKDEYIGWWDHNDEWICVYSYVDGAIKRIGQTRSWVQMLENGSYTYYDPVGYLGSVLSSYNYPTISDDCLYYCRGTDGKIYLADNDPSSYWDDRVAFYTYDGSMMAESVYLHTQFIPDWSVGSIHSSYGRYAYYVNRESVSSSYFNSVLNRHRGSNWTKLVNNDYNTVLNTLANALTSYYTPSAWAAAEVNMAINSGFVPKNLQKNYTKAITRAEFCALATRLYEGLTGEEITDRMEFTDTEDVNVQKMGALGIVGGTGGGAFSPNNSLTRQEAAAILGRLAARLSMRTQSGELTFADNDKIADWAKASVATIVASNVMGGVGNNKFDPLGSYTREQAILTIMRLSMVPIGEPIAVTGVSLSANNLTLVAGDEHTLTATVSPADATDKKVVWSSSNESVLTVSKTGVITAVHEGIAVVTADASGHTATCVVTVEPVRATGITLDRTNAFLNVGKTLALVATLTPEDASTEHTTWTSSDPSVATVSSTGVVTGVKEGTAVISVEAFGAVANCTVTVSTAPLGLQNFVKSNEYNGQFSDVFAGWYYDSVKNAYEYGLMSGTTATSFNPGGNLSIAESLVIACRLHNTYFDNNATFAGTGAWYQGYVNYAFENGIIRYGEYSDYTATANRMQFACILAASVPPEALAPINNVGNKIPDVPPEMAGSDSVYLLYNAGILSGSSAYGDFNPTSSITRAEVAAIITRIADPASRKTFTLLNKVIPAEEVLISDTYVGLTKGESFDLSAEVLPSNSTQTNFVWTSSNPSVATVSDSGHVTAVGVGKATITVKVGTVSDSCTVSVAAEPLVFSGHGNKDITGISLDRGAYYVEYVHEGTGAFKIYSMWNYGYGDSYIAEDVGNCSGSGFITKALEESVSNFSMEITAKGDWTIKLHKVNDYCSTNLRGSGNCVAGMFDLPGNGGTTGVTITTSHDSEGQFRVYVYRVDGSSYEFCFEYGVHENVEDTLWLQTGKTYVIIVSATGNWHINLGLGDKLQTIPSPSF